MGEERVKKGKEEEENRAAKQDAPGLLTSFPGF